MKITINSKKLLNAVQKVGACIKQNHTLPLYQNILLTTGKHTLEIMASNLEITALTEVPATIEGKVHTCINYQMFSSILNNMPNGGLVLEFTDKQVRMTLGDSDYELPLMDPTGFQTQSDLQWTNSFKVNTQKLLSSLKRAEKFTINDDLRPSMSSVNIHCNGKDLMVVATDSHQLYHETLQPIEQEFELLLHRSSIGYLTGTEFEEELEILYTDKKVVFKDPVTWVEVVLVDAKYVNYSVVIPKEPATTVLETEKSLFLNKIQNLSPIYSVMEDKTIKVELKKNETVFSCHNDFLNNKGKEVLPVAIEGSELAIGFNAEILKEMANVVSSETIKVNFTQPNRAAWLDQDNIIALAMPHMLTN